ncbi:MAG: hypothetical protein ACRC5T_03585 [Cetobacterium sp.]
MNFWKNIEAWFSPERRQAIYGAVAAIAPALVGVGVLAEGQVEAILIIVAAVLQSGAGILALLNLTPGQAGTWFQTVGRGVVYSLAATVAPAAVALGWFTEATSLNILTGVSLVLTLMSSVLGVVIVNQKVTAAAIESASS